uniref:Apple domain-containing protein n=1 Tax=Romanomermis culicivorax TaxID=13658 RepID=A0A915J893_ROMCU
MFLFLLLLDYANFCFTQYNAGVQEAPVGGYASPAPVAQPGSVAAPGPSYASAYGKVYRITYTNYNRPPPEDRIFDGLASCIKKKFNASSITIGSPNISPGTPSCCPNVQTSGSYNTANKLVPSPSSYYNKPAPAPYYGGYGNSPGGSDKCCSPVGPPTLPHPGTPDTSDPCFSKYSDCLIELELEPNLEMSQEQELDPPKFERFPPMSERKLNVQPYERRPRFTVDQCKNLCQTSRLSNPQSPFACRSFVYDNNKQLCDLFAHTGTQSPSRLGKMPGWDYYVLNANNPQCQAGWTTISGTTATWPIGPTPFPNNLSPKLFGELVTSCPSSGHRYIMLQHVQLVKHCGGIEQPAMLSAVHQYCKLARQQWINVRRYALQTDSSSDQVNGFVLMYQTLFSSAAKATQP